MPIVWFKPLQPASTSTPRVKGAKPAKGQRRADARRRQLQIADCRLQIDWRFILQSAICNLQCPALGPSLLRSLPILTCFAYKLD